ncbi:MAG: possible integral membrane protein [uncultured Nocardioidaceae bacterium]|uniref:Possible integral membrane protein n=1 Tax=uncultured Nocardioidaceae bacterium TaxID=253824 RepID=A0A6J4M5R2_9ACTN|nr:MAG: possible integral membrane protein [uncultured Nocardioidaceae bacterium]
MNRTVATLTRRSLLGRRRTVVLLLLPLALLALCTLARVLAGLDAEIARELDRTLAPDLLGAFGIAVLMPLLSLIAGTGSIGPEIDEGSIVYLLAKPLNRYSIVVTKLLVAVGVVVVFGVVPVAVAGVVLTGEVGPVTVGHALGALAGGTAYAAIFLLLAVLTKNAVVIGLIYALIWESLIGGLVPGAQTLSVQQWSLSVVEEVLGSTAGRVGVSAAVEPAVGLILLVVVTLAATAYAGRRLQTVRIGESD